MSVNDIQSNGRRLGAIDEHGYDTFWGCPQAGSSQRKGLNGVATFARKGLTEGAISRVFQDNSLDNEGRCIMTDHGDFVIFNVYVPFSGVDYVRLAYKMKLLKALRSAMQLQRTMGKHVILVGDMNITLRGIDCCQFSRVVNMEKEIEQFDTSKSSCFLSEEARVRVQYIWTTLQEAWLGVKSSLRNSRTVEKFPDGREQIRVISPSGKELRLGKKSSSVSLFDFNLEEYRVNDIDDCDGGHLARRANTLSVDEWREIFSKLAIGGCNLQEEDWRLVADVWGMPKHSPCSTEWLEKLLIEDDMIDSFGETHPYAHGRYTCWNQQENCRYSNEGARLDYILVDKKIWTFPRQKRHTLAGYTTKGIEHKEPQSLPNRTQIGLEHLAALNAATANMKFCEAPKDGGGLPEAVSEAYDEQFNCGNGNTIGKITDTLHSINTIYFLPYHVTSLSLNVSYRFLLLVYTPPEFSDHVAVQCIIQGTCVEHVIRSDLATKSCQPHLKQSLLTSFFSSGTSTMNGNHVQAESSIKDSSAILSLKSKHRNEPTETVTSKKQKILDERKRCFFQPKSK